MSGNIPNDGLPRWREFWQACVRLLEVYPQRPAKLSADAEPVPIQRELRQLAQEGLRELCENSHWLADASVGKGDWAKIPWVAILDSREAPGPQQGVYPVLHFSPEEPIGIRIGLGVSTTAFKGREHAKAKEVWGELTEGERRWLGEAGFGDVIKGTDERVAIGAGNLASKYAKGMLFERFVPLETLQAAPDELTESLGVLVRVYKAWVDRKFPNDAERPSFLEVMREYAAQGVVFFSPERSARYFIRDVDDKGCSVERLDANEPTRVTSASFQERRERLRQAGGSMPRAQLDNTVTRHMCYMQAADVALSADRKSATYLANSQEATDLFISWINSMKTAASDKRAILRLVVEAVRDGDLNENHIEFDWLLPRFVARMREHGQEADEQRLAEAFVGMATDLFWLLAHHDPSETVTLDNATAGLIRSRVSHARLQAPYWHAIQVEANRRRLLAILNGEILVASLAERTEVLIARIAEHGFVYQPWQIAAYITALRTKPFVILAGVSGTGKSKLPLLVSQLTGGESKRISVRPDWTDSSEVLGYVDLSDKFRPGILLERARQATEDSARYHVCLIDEMNLARVEHYFAEVLSAIEDRRKLDEGGYESGELLAQELTGEFAFWRKQRLPRNLGIVGTVNMDESAHSFSRKVLDRAFTIELSEVDLTQSEGATVETNGQPATRDSWPLDVWLTPATRLADLDSGEPHVSEAIELATNWLVQINRALVHSQLQVGYRTRDEVVLFLVHAKELEGAFRTRDGQPVDPLDLTVMMKILPRLVGGSNALRKTMLELMGLAMDRKPFGTDDATDAVDNWEKSGRPDAVAGARLPRTAARLCMMWERLHYEGYTSFWL